MRSSFAVLVNDLDPFAVERALDKLKQILPKIGRLPMHDHGRSTHNVS